MRQYRCTILGSAILLLISVFLECVNIKNQFNIGVLSVADFMILNENIFYFGIVISLIVTTSIYFLLYKDEKIQTIILFGSRKNIFRKQVCQLVGMSLILTLCFNVSLILCGGMMSSSYINWSHGFSTFTNITGETSDMSFITFLGWFFVLTLLCFVCISLVALLFWWMNKKLLAILFFLFLTGIDGSQKILQIFFRRILLNYDKISSSSDRIMALLFGLLYCGLLYLVGLKIVERRDFLNEK